MQESMGPIVDRTLEHLGSSDRAVIAARRLLIQTAKSLTETDQAPALGPSYYNVRAIDQIVAEGSDWRGALETEVYPTFSPEKRAETFA